MKTAAAGGYPVGMNEPREAPRMSVVGYAIGAGLTVMAIVGSVAHFAFPPAPDWLLLLGGFIVGAALAAWRASVARPTHGSPD